jgi:hypothetical protein
MRRSEDLIVSISPFLGETFLLTCGNGDDGVGDLGSEVSLGSLLHLGQDHGRDLLRGLRKSTGVRIKRGRWQWSARVNPSQDLRTEFDEGEACDVTYEFLELVPVLDLDDGLAFTADNLEGPEVAIKTSKARQPKEHKRIVSLSAGQHVPVLDVLLHVRVDKVPSDQSLGVENGVLRVRRTLVLGGVSDQSFVVRETDP